MHLETVSVRVVATDLEAQPAEGVAAARAAVGRPLADGDAAVGSRVDGLLAGGAPAHAQREPTERTVSAVAANGECCD